MNTNDRKTAQEKIQTALKRAHNVQRYELQQCIFMGLAAIRGLVEKGLDNDLVNMVNNQAVCNAVRSVAYNIATEAGLMEKQDELFLTDYFTVDAGKIEPDGERNYKVCNAYRNIGEALDMVRECRSYHFVEFQYVNHNGERFTVDLDPVPVKT